MSPAEIDWRPMETAPRNMTVVRLRGKIGAHNCPLAMWMGDAWLLVDSGLWVRSDPLGWSPLEGEEDALWNREA